MKAHLLFEQSGTFKNEFKKLGYEAYDYDILNDFGETDFKIDLFNEIEKAYGGGESIFDTMSKDDIIFAFFPCVRFEAEITLSFRGDAVQQKNWSDEKKLEYCIKLHRELSEMYELVSKLGIVVLNKGLRMVLENPCGNGQHYLNRYWCIKPRIIDNDRSKNGDYFVKPTQYWMFNMEPEQNMLFEAMEINKGKLGNQKYIKSQDGIKRQVLKSMISPTYANRFIRTYILPREDIKENKKRR